MSVNEWINDELHNILGFSDKFTAEFLLNLASKSVSADVLIEKIKDTGTLSINSSVIQFASELWTKVPHAEIKEKPSRAREREIMEMLKKNESYKLIDDEDDYTSVYEEKRSKKSKKIKNLRKREASSSDSDDASSKVAKVSQKAQSDSESDYEKMERERLEDLKERDEFSARLKKKDKEKTRNIVEKSDRKAFEEAAKRLRLEQKIGKKLYQN
ncbi:pre-mRNA-splicing factor ATP-dependent RNA helicase DHX16 [Trichonephila clavata]|uniref:Pre-mRNA-splicing factor ATP-dependent RNA helicase DHX16 n=1 Tax=Trichonephila clavata TaxID=2740835 RepID=A0A8X6H2X6_TRICU|nr:pre-mRNA-splicing factor ATP-dependent RNA helicase DHX16 [Trichonephila clavata]